MDSEFDLKAWVEDQLRSYVHPIDSDTNAQDVIVRAVNGTVVLFDGTQLFVMTPEMAATLADNLINAAIEARNG